MKKVKRLSVLLFSYAAGIFAWESNSGISVNRSFDSAVCLPGDTIRLTVQISNAASDIIRGFYFSEFIPEGLGFDVESVRIGETEITDFFTETGSPGAVYHDLYTFRCVLETPPAFSEDNAVPDEQTLVMVFKLYSDDPGPFELSEYSWVCLLENTEEAAFGHSGPADAQILNFTSVQLSANIFLEGPYSAGTGAMTTHLNTAGHIPLTSPHADARTVSSVPADVTDWIFIELRSEAAGEAVSVKSAFLHKDGRIVADDGTTHAVALAASPGTYYVVIRHRNHLAVMSASAIDFTSGSGSFDFTGSGAQYYGTNGYKLLASGVYGMFAGDVNQDGHITTTDYTAWFNSALTGASGYHSEDINLDFHVTTSDYTMWYNNALSGASSAVPNL